MKTAVDILEHTRNLVGGDRQNTHGDKVDSHDKIARLWNAYLRIRRDPGAPLTAEDVAWMMVLFKVCRAQVGSLNPDDYCDAAGYSAIAGECALHDDDPAIGPC